MAKTGNPKWRDSCDVSELVGLTLSGVRASGDEVYFDTECGRTFKMYHGQDCCETVLIDDVVGDWADLIGSPMVAAYQADSDDLFVDPYADDRWRESFTWTFYHISTNKGTVTLRWYGTSNGYYSESVDFGELK